MKQHAWKKDKDLKKKKKERGVFHLCVAKLHKFLKIKMVKYYLIIV